MSDNDTKFKPEEIPASVTLDAVLFYNIAGAGAGKINLYAFPFKGDAARIILVKTTVTVDIPPVNAKGVRSKALDMLNVEKQEVLANNHKRLKDVQEKIDMLMCIEYQPEDAEADLMSKAEGGL